MTQTSHVNVSCWELVIHLDSFRSAAVILSWFLLGPKSVCRKRATRWSRRFVKHRECVSLPIRSHISTYFLILRMTDDGFDVIIADPWNRWMHVMSIVYLGTKPGLSRFRSCPFLGHLSRVLMVKFLIFERFDFKANIAIILRHGIYLDIRRCHLHFII